MQAMNIEHRMKFHVEVLASDPHNCWVPMVAKERLGQSARGLAHSKTRSRIMERREIRQVLECASPLALFFRVIRLMSPLHEHMAGSELNTKD